MQLFFCILIKFTKTNNYNTKAKGAWKYITTLRLTLNMETQILQQVTCNCSWMKEIRCTRFPMGLKILGICLKIDVVQLLREMKRLLCNVMCKESPYNLINVSGHFSVICNYEIVIKLNF